MYTLIYFRESFALSTSVRCSMQFEGNVVDSMYVRWVSYELENRKESSPNVRHFTKDRLTILRELNDERLTCCVDHAWPWCVRIHYPWVVSAASSDCVHWQHRGPRMASCPANSSINPNQWREEEKPWSAWSNASETEQWTRQRILDENEQRTRCFRKVRLMTAGDSGCCCFIQILGTGWKNANVNELTNRSGRLLTLPPILTKIEPVRKSPGGRGTRW